MAHACTTAALRSGAPFSICANVGAGGQHEVDPAQVKVQGLAVFAARLPSSLEYSAIHREAVFDRPRQATGTGDLFLIMLMYAQCARSARPG